MKRERELSQTKTAIRLREWRKTEAGKEYHANYRKSDKGKQANANYRKTDKGKQANANYKKSDKGKQAQARAAANYKKSDKGQQALARATAEKQALAAEEFKKLCPDTIDFREPSNKAALLAKTDEIAKKPRDQFGGRSLDELVDEIIKAEESLILVNLSYTRVQIKDEWYGFLRARGSSKQLPILTKPGGETFTASEAVEALGFTWVQLDAFSTKTNARAIEGQLQKRYHDRLPPGLRLWKEVDRGGMHDRSDDVGKSHKVFITMSRKIFVKEWVMQGDELDLGETLANLGVQLNPG